MATRNAHGAAADGGPLASWSNTSALARAALAAPYRAAPAAPAGFAAAAALEVSAPLAEATALSVLLLDAGKKALNAGAAGGVAMTANVAALMWLRTTIQFQYRRDGRARARARARGERRVAAH